jgi:epsin
MDWNDLRNQVSNLSVYDLKAGVRKVQNGMYARVSKSAGII